MFLYVQLECFYLYLMFYIHKTVNGHCDHKGEYFTDNGLVLNILTVCIFMFQTNSFLILFYIFVNFIDLPENSTFLTSCRFQISFAWADAGNFGMPN